MSICQCSNFKFKLVFKKIEIPSHIKKFADKATANLLQIHCKFINLNRSFNFAEVAALPTEISINKLP
jgi:hypothetical protein